MTAHFQNLRRWATSFHFLEVEHGIFLQATFKMLWRNYDIWSMIWSLLTCWRDRHFWYLQGPDTGISYQVCLLSTVPSLSDGDSVWCYVSSVVCWWSWTVWQLKGERHQAVFVPLSERGERDGRRGPALASETPIYSTKQNRRRSIVV